MIFRITPVDYFFLFKLFIRLFPQFSLFIPTFIHSFPQRLYYKPFLTTKQSIPVDNFWKLIFSKI